ncbi:OmpA family protein [Chelatococcus sambhunathii]|uniref:OmpA family protein n=2 Tax=Chelatococcus sambhunathii TaxID=363953 RepID=A0ABU1DKE4_9HYPH|nr:OmpA family protein [Chelatococcus sambhunathii]
MKGGDKADDRQDRQDRRDDAREERRDDRQQEKIDRLRDKNQSLQDRIRENRKDGGDRDRNGGIDVNIRLDALKNQRRERRDGDRVIITEPGGRTIIREGGRTIIRRDETARFRIDARDVREERRGGEIRTVVTRPDGSRVITITDEDGRLLRRIRESGGREYVLIDNSPRGGRGRDGYFVDLDIAPPRISIPRERYIVDADRASEEDIYEAFDAEPVARPERSYSLDEIRQSEPLRQYVRSVDLDAITFDTGSWEVRDDQIGKLEKVGKAMEQAIKKNPRTVFMIEGHTDAVGSDEDNLSLSDRRAESVAEVITKYFDVPAENLTTQGYGEKYLKVQTDGPEERNRRVTMRNITSLLSSENR